MGVEDDLGAIGDGGAEEVGGEGLTDGVAELLEAGDIVLVEEALGGGRDVQEKDGVATDGAIVNGHEFVEGLHLVVLAGVPEPTGADGDIALSGIPHAVVGADGLVEGAEGKRVGGGTLLGELAAGHGGDVLAIEVEGGEAVTDGLVVDGLGRDDGPLAVAGKTGLVADPADVGAGDGDDAVWVARTDGGVVAGPIVDLLLAVGAFAAGAVKPDFVDGAIVIEELVELADEEVIVGVCAVGRLVAVPRGEVKTDLEAFGAAGIGKLTTDIALTILPRRGGNGVVRELGGPKAEAVVVLGGENGELEAGLFKGLGPLAAVEGGGIEDLGILFASAPFAIGEGVDAEVDEGRQLQLLPGHLTRVRLDLGDLGDLGDFGGGEVGEAKLGVEGRGDKGRGKGKDGKRCFHGALF